MARIKVIQEHEAEGTLQEIYQNLVKSRGKLADVHKIQSLNPKTILSHMELYMDIMYGQSPLKRWQREMIAVVVSTSNRCEYCARHHAEALHIFWKQEDKIKLLMNGEKWMNWIRLIPYGLTTLENSRLNPILQKQKLSFKN